MADMKQISEDVTRTWALVAAQPLEPVGVAFFLKIFEIAPEALRVHTRVQPSLSRSGTLICDARGPQSSSPSRTSRPWPSRPSSRSTPWPL